MDEIKTIIASTYNNTFKTDAALWCYNWIEQDWDWVWMVSGGIKY